MGNHDKRNKSQNSGFLHLTATVLADSNLHGLAIVELIEV